MGLASLLGRKQAADQPIDNVKFSLTLPAHGKVIVSPHSSMGCDAHGDDIMKFHGEVEILLPPGMRDRVYKDLRVVMLGYSTMDMGPGRGVETDVFWEHTIYANLPDQCKRLGEEHGETNKIFTTFQYCVALPPADMLRTCPRVDWTLAAQLIGLKPSLEPPDLPPHLSLATIEKDDHLKSFPILDEHVAPLERTLTARTNIEFIHNPGMDQQSNTLDDYSASHAPELGLVVTSCGSDNFTVAGPFTSRISVTGPSPKICVHGVRLSILQRETCTSPRDKKSVTSETIVRFCEEGDSSGSSPPLWKGQESDGTDDRTCSVDLSGRLPHSSQIRQSTLPGINTPLTVDHFIVYDVFFSVNGEDASGKPVNGPAGIRRFRKRRRVVVPHCALSSHKVELPTYGQDKAMSILSEYYDEWCNACNRPASQVICTTCEERAIPHTKLKPGDGPNDPCPDCADKTLKPKPATDHHFKGECACTDWCRIFNNPNNEDVRAFKGSVVEDESSADLQLATKLQDEWDSTISSKRSSNGNGYQ